LLAEGLEPHYVSEQWYFAKAARDQKQFVDIDGYIDKKIDALCQHDAQMVLTIADMQQQLRASGLDIPWLAQLDPHDYREPIAMRMKATAQAVAKHAGLGCQYAEGFRRTRYGGIGVARQGPDDREGRVVPHQPDGEPQVVVMLSGSEASSPCGDACVDPHGRCNRTRPFAGASG